MLEKIGVVIADELKQAVKDKKVVVLIFSYLVVLATAIKYGSIFKLVAGLFFFSSEMDVAVIVPYYISVMVIPAFALLLSYDSISGELHGNSIRYIVSRIDRLSILLGKYTAAAVILLSVNLVSYLVIAVNHYYSTGMNLIGDYMTAFAYLIFYSLCFLSIGFLGSSVTKKPSTSLWIGMTIITTTLLMLIKDFLVSIVPFHYVNRFLLGNMTEGIVVFSVIAIGGLVISYLVFRRMDL